VENLFFMVMWIATEMWELRIFDLATLNSVPCNHLSIVCRLSCVGTLCLIKRGKSRNVVLGIFQCLSSIPRRNGC
jgi:hypothetical protein